MTQKAACLASLGAAALSGYMLAFDGKNADFGPKLVFLRCSSILQRLCLREREIYSQWSESITHIHQAKSDRCLGALGETYSRLFCNTEEPEVSSTHVFDVLRAPQSP